MSQKNSSPIRLSRTLARDMHSPLRASGEIKTQGINLPVRDQGSPLRKSKPSLFQEQRRYSEVFSNFKDIQKNIDDTLRSSTSILKVKSPGSSLRKTGMTQKLQKHASFASPSVISQENSFMGKSFNDTKPIKTAVFSGTDFY